MKNCEVGKHPNRTVPLDNQISSDYQISTNFVSYAWEWNCNPIKYHLQLELVKLKVNFLICSTISGQMFLLDRFFDGTFITFGVEVLSFADRDQEDRIDPMVYVFPRMTKCTFHKFGTSGEIEKHDALCILPLNIFNEKIYIFLWFWMLILGVLTLIVVVYRLGICFSGTLRTYLMKIRYRRIRTECIEIIMEKSMVGDWFLMYLLGQNIDQVIFKDVMQELAKKLGYRSKDSIE